MQGKKKIALITGITGQDGFYLAKSLIARGLVVYGTSRRLQSKLIINENVKIEVKKTDYSIKSLIKILDNLNPDILYNLAGQSYVSRSWELLNETILSQGMIVSNILSAVQKTSPKIKILNMTSAEIFDHSDKQPFNEKSPRKPYNPYGCAQLLGHDLIEVYREVKGFWAANAILFPHESERRAPEFLFPRVINEAKNISLDQRKILKIGNLETIRDWGYAPIFMDGVAEQSLLKDPIDFCFSTNQPFKVKHLLERIFSNLGLNYKNFIKVDKSLVRNYEPKKSVGNYKKANTILGWKPELNALNIIDLIMKK